MAAVSVLPQVPQPIVYPDAIEVGEVTIPIGPIQDCSSFHESSSDQNIYKARLFTKGAMGLKGKTVIVTFAFLTAEKTHQFFQDLLARAKASFSLPAISIKPELVQSDNGVKGVIDIQFRENSECEQFLSCAAPVFFPDFTAAVLNGNIVELVWNEGTEDDTIQRMNQAFKELNNQTHFQIGEFLSKSADPRFHAERRAPIQELLSPHSPKFPPHYYVEFDGSIKKYVHHFGSPSTNHPAHTIQRCPNTTSSYFVAEPLQSPNISSVNFALSETLALVEKISKISDKLADRFTDFMQYLKVEQEKQTPRTPVEWEILRNQTRSLLLINLEGLTSEEENLIRPLLEKFAETQQKIVHEA
jgi:hypothetical protein